VQETRVTSNVVMRLQGRLPMIPRGLYRDPRVSAPESYQARYISISSIDMLYPSPTYEEYKDHDIEDFYSAVPGW
jgi:hypothetical protein